MELYDPKHGVKMGVPNGNCDDAETNLFVDWCSKEDAETRPECTARHTCYSPTRPILPNPRLEPDYYEDKSSEGYTPLHYCMDRTLKYKEALPTYGDHRPLWAKFGEYRYGFGVPALEHIP